MPPLLYFAACLRRLPAHNESVTNKLLLTPKSIGYPTLHDGQDRQSDPSLFAGRRPNSVFKAWAKGGLTGPAVAERVRRLEEMEVIRGYHAAIAAISYASVGYRISAVMEVTYPSSQAQRMYSLAGMIPEILECCHVTGNSSAVLRVVARSVQQKSNPAMRFCVIVRSTIELGVSSKSCTSRPLHKGLLQ